MELDCSLSLVLMHSEYIDTHNLQRQVYEIELKTKLKKKNF